MKRFCPLVVALQFFPDLRVRRAIGCVVAPAKTPERDPIPQARSVDVDDDRSWKEVAAEEVGDRGIDLGCP